MPSVSSSDATQVTGFPLGQLPLLRLEEALYYLPWSSPVKGLGLHRTELHCVYTQKNSIFNTNGMTANIVSWSALCRTTFSEDQGHYSWLLKMSLTLNPCKQTLALTFRGVFPCEKLPDALIFNPSRIPVLWENSLWFLLKYPPTQQPHRNAYTQVSSNARGMWLPFT